MSVQFPFSLNLGGRLWQISRPQIMGILNLTPDSFFDGGRYQDPKSICMRCAQMLAEGADLIDVGGYSSRPGAQEVTPEEESRRVKEGVQLIKKHFPSALISVDTFRAEVAKIALAEGASMVNDISAGGLDPKMYRIVAEAKIPYIAMHMRGTPQNMQTLTNYTALLSEVIDYFVEKIEIIRAWGINDLIIDPGFGFAKSTAQNFALFRELEQLHCLNLPVLVGISRKSMIWKTLGGKPENALHGSTALHTLALEKGTHFLRVHDVKAAKDTLKIWEELLQK